MWTRKERRLALDLRVPFITGPAVCRLRSEPLGGSPWAFDHLPARSPDEAPGADRPALRKAS